VIDDNPLEAGQVRLATTLRGGGGDEGNNKDDLLHHDLFDGSFDVRTTFDSIDDGSFASNSRSRGDKISVVRWRKIDD
jgi:hypothetical protein